MALDNNYNREMSGATGFGFYDPLTGTWSGLPIGGGSSSSTPSTPPLPTPKGTDVKINLLKDKSSTNTKTLSFKINNNIYFENNLVSLDSNELNDVTVIKGESSDTQKVLNYFTLEKTTVLRETEVFDDVVTSYIDIAPYSSLFNFQNRNLDFSQFTNLNREVRKTNKVISVTKPGIKVNEYNSSNDLLLQSVSYVYPTIFDLVFKTEANVVIPTIETKRTLQFISNYTNKELLDELEIKVSSKDLESDKILKLKDSDTVNVDFAIKGKVFQPITISTAGFNNFKLKNIRWQYVDKFDDNSELNVENFTASSDTVLTLTNDNFVKNIIVLIEVEPNSGIYPTITTPKNIIDYKITESIIASTSLTKVISFDADIKNVDYLKIVTPYKSFNYNLSATDLQRKTIDLDFKTHFQNNVGSFKVAVTPYSNLYGDGNTVFVVVNLESILDIPIIDKINYPKDVYIPTYTFGNINFSIDFKTNIGTYVLIYHSKEDPNTLIGKYKSTEKVTFNYKDLKDRKIIKSPLDLIIIPFNDTIKGDPLRIQINFSDAGIYVSSEQLKNNLRDAIWENLNLDIPNNSKYLSYLTSFNTNDTQIVVSNWDIDSTTFTKFKKDELGNDIPDGEINKSVVLKLYEPLPENINKNDVLWVSKIMALPIIENVVVRSNPEDNALPLRAPNFNIEVDYVKGQSTTYQTFNDLVLSGSQTSQQIVDKYLSENLVNTNIINVDYSNFSNFVKYSSAVERLANFKYKKELIEYYEDRISFLTTTIVDNTNVNNLNELETFKEKLSAIVVGLDGWEKDLISGSHNFTADSASYAAFPTGSDGFAFRFNSASFEANGTVYTKTPYDVTTNWYLGTYDSASVYDSMNLSMLKNNIPTFIGEDDENAEFLLFLDMIGNHFDIIWTYIKGMTDQRLLGEKNNYGINDELLYNYLESFSWNAKNLNSNKQLWNYTFGQDSNGDGIMDDVDGYTITPEEYTKKVWRRIANNLPYLLKHKGTTRAVKALMACYGIPQSILSIMEFGGPKADTQESGSNFTYTTLSSTLVFETGSYITANWLNSPQAIEFRVKPKYSSSVDLVSGSGFKLFISGGANESKQYGSLQLNVNGSTVLSSSAYTFFDGDFHTILINKIDNSYTASFGKAERDRVVKNENLSGIGSLAWDSGSQIVFGNFNGEMDEVRIWKNALSSSVFDVHLLNSEAVLGNHISASTIDLLLRLDFEVPKNLALTGSIKNVAPNNLYMGYVSASGFSNLQDYNSTTQQHWNYKYINKEVSVTLPNTGITRLTNNKVRFENQGFIYGNDTLSVTKRVTKGTFDTSPTDSNRIGLFFSPNKDLDLDIAKSIGGDYIDDYFGDPKDEYKYNYEDLDKLRNYYFERVNNRNIYDFIKLIKFFDKSFFENVKELLPARAKVTKGLLIAPHFLERNKIKINKPHAETEDLQGIITDTQIYNLSSSFDTYEGNLNLSQSLENIGVEKNDYDGLINAEKIYNFSGEKVSYDGFVSFSMDDKIKAEYNTYEGTINYKRDEATLLGDLDYNKSQTIVGLGRYEDYGFGTYFNNGYGKYFYEENGIIKSKAVRGFLVKKYDSKILTNLERSGSEGLEGTEYTYLDTGSTYLEFIVQEYRSDGIFATASLDSDPKIISITTASGYLPNHYIYTKDTHTGRENLFFRGSKFSKDSNNNWNTIDGKEPVETYTTNPTVLRVTPQGRSNNEPILEVD